MLVPEEVPVQPPVLLGAHGGRVPAHGPAQFTETNFLAKISIILPGARLRLSPHFLPSTMSSQGDQGAPEDLLTPRSYSALCPCDYDYEEDLPPNFYHSPPQPPSSPELVCNHEDDSDAEWRYFGSLQEAQTDVMQAEREKAALFHEAPNDNKFTYLPWRYASPPSCASYFLHVHI